MNQNTTPVIIQDKNGKTTTVHKKLHSGSPAGASIPQLGGSKTPAEVPTTDEAVASLAAWGVRVHDNTQVNLQFLSETKPELLKTLIDTIGAADDHERSIWETALSMSAYVPEDEEDEPRRFLGHYHRFIHTIPLGVKLLPEESRSTGDRALYKIKQLSTPCERRMGWSPSQKQYREAKAAMIAVAVAGGEYKFDWKSRMEDIFWIADHLEDVEPLIPSLLERKDTSRGFIEALMENEASALTSGLL